MHVTTFHLMRSIILTLFFLVIFVMPAHAQFQNNVNQNAANLGLNATNDLITIIQNIVNVLLGFVGFLALLMVVWGGIRYIISRGNEDEVEKAKYTIFYALVGLLVIGISAALVNFVLEALQ